MITSGLLDSTNGTITLSSLAAVVAASEFLNIRGIRKSSS
jgi:hypothetical protein